MIRVVIGSSGSTILGSCRFEFVVDAWFVVRTQRRELIAPIRFVELKLNKRNMLTVGFAVVCCLNINVVLFEECSQLCKKCHFCGNPSIHRFAFNLEGTGSTIPLLRGHSPHKKRLVTFANHRRDRPSNLTTVPAASLSAIRSSYNVAISAKDLLLVMTNGKPFRHSSRSNNA